MAFYCLLVLCCPVHASFSADDRCLDDGARTNDNMSLPDVKTNAWFAYDMQD